MHLVRSGAASHEKHRFAHPERNVTALGIDAGMKVADFGAGSGAYVLSMAAAVGPHGVVYAIDIQKDLLRRIANEAKRNGFENIHVVWGDLEEPHGSKLKDELVEVVLISNLLFQVRDKKGVLREAVRILRTGGRLAIIDWSESFGGMGPHKDEVVTKDAAYELAHAAGLLYVDEFPAGAHHYGLIFRKTKKGA